MFNNLLKNVYRAYFINLYLHAEEVITAKKKSPF